MTMDGMGREASYCRSDGSPGSGHRISGCRKLPHAIGWLLTGSQSDCALLAVSVTQFDQAGCAGVNKMAALPVPGAACLMSFTLRVNDALA